MKVYALVFSILSLCFAHGSSLAFLDKSAKKVVLTNRTQVKESSSCIKKVPPEVRDAFYLFFAQVSEAEYSRIPSWKLAKMMGMAIKESSGNFVAVADMSGRGSAYSYRSFFSENKSSGILSRPHKVSLKLRNKIFNYKSIRMTKQTNFGILQLSSDILVNYSGPLVIMNQARAAAKSNPDAFLANCGTTTVYRDSLSSLKKELTSLQSCTPGIKSTSSIKCFGKWVTFCPSLSFTLASYLSNRYFATRKASPICESSMKQISKDIKTFVKEVE